MSKKYVIEMKSEYEDTIRGIMVLGARDSNLYTDALAVEDMEELNSDYINEHYSDLQDDAYQRGFEKGKDVRIKGCEGCMYQDTTIEHNPCNLCCNAFLNRWTAKDDKIEVGDEVERYINGKLDSKGIYLGDTDEEGDYWNCLFWTGAVFTILAYPKHQFKRTGRHFDIDKILEEMRND